MRRVSARRCECWIGARRAGRGRVGTVAWTYGHPDHLALDVRFEDGSVELYWYHELGRIEGFPDFERSG